MTFFFFTGMFCEQTLFMLNGGMYVNKNTYIALVYLLFIKQFMTDANKLIERKNIYI